MNRARQMRSLTLQDARRPGAFFPLSHSGDELPAPARLSVNQGFGRGALDRDAVKVVSRLLYSGFVAYLVGGCVRDLLLGVGPKDFDIATDARPRQVKRLFGNSRIIGRRFRLVHITFAGKILEVSTFRTLSTGVQDHGDPLIRRDNVFGLPHEDAWRRDLTVNGLFYDIRSGEVIDYVGGLRDLRQRVIRTIGNPWVRFREDPVRLLRAIKFAGRLDFRFADDLYQALIDCREDIWKAAPPRLHEEIVRIMNRGAARASLILLYKTGLLDLLLPEVARPLDERTLEGNAGSFWQAFQALDGHMAVGRPLPSCLLWAQLFLAGLEQAVFPGDPERQLPRGELEALVEQTLRPVALRLRFSRREVALVKQILGVASELLRREKRGGRRRRLVALVRQEAFPQALKLFQAHVEATGKHAPILEFWSEQARQR